MSERYSGGGENENFGYLFPMKITRISALAILVVVVVAALYLAQALLIPLVVAIGIWLLVNAISDSLERVPVIGNRLPPWLRKSGAMVIITGFLWLSVEIIIQSVNQMLTQADSYEVRLSSLFTNVLGSLGINELPNLSELANGANLQPALADLGGAISTFAGDFFLVILYTIFLLIEQNTFPAKWRSMFKQEAQLDNASHTLDRIVRSIREYVLVKTGVNLATGLLCWVFMQVLGLDFALFWGFLIFLLNFVPTFGSFVAVGLPTLFALLQFEDYAPVLGIMGGTMLVHGVIGYMLEPRLMGRTLNISPLVILISLSVWGAVWGLIGMILAVPITVSLMTALAAFPSSRPFAVWLSADGLREG
jgi:AI-2 transport protein TqsA